MKARDIMTQNPRVVTPETPVQEAARLMKSEDTGVLPVVEIECSRRLIGMITDRDIAIRAVAQGKGPDTPVREVMSKDIKYCYDDEDLEHVAKNMGDIQVRRLPVVNREKRLVGIVSLGDIAQNEDHSTTGEAAAGVSQPGGQHRQK